MGGTGQADRLDATAESEVAGRGMTRWSWAGTPSQEGALSTLGLELQAGAQSKRGKKTLLWGSNGR